MLQSECSLSKIGFDGAENEPSEVWHDFYLYLAWIPDAQPTGPARALPLVLGAVLVGAVVAGAVLVQYLYGAAFPPPDPLDF